MADCQPLRAVCRLCWWPLVAVVVAVGRRSTGALAALAAVRAAAPRQRLRLLAVRLRALLARWPLNPRFSRLCSEAPVRRAQAPERAVAGQVATGLAITSRAVLTSVVGLVLVVLSVPPARVAQPALLALRLLHLTTAPAVVVVAKTLLALLDRPAWLSLSGLAKCRVTHSAYAGIVALCTARTNGLASALASMNALGRRCPCLLFGLTAWHRP